MEEETDWSQISRSDQRSYINARPHTSGAAFHLLPILKKPLSGKLFRSIEGVSNEVNRINNEGVLTGIQDLPKRWTAVIKHNGDYIEGL